MATSWPETRKSDSNKTETLIGKKDTTQTLNGIANPAGKPNDVCAYTLERPSYKQHIQKKNMLNCSIL